MGKSTIMGIFNSYVKLPEGIPFVCGLCGLVLVCLADTQGISWPRQEGFGQDAQALFNELSRLIEKDGRLWFLGPSVAAGEAMAHRNS